MKRKTLAAFALSQFALAALLFLACDRSTTPPPLPASGQIAPGTTYSVAALVAAVAPSGVTITYSVEPGGGTITQTGAYTAPGCPEILAAVGPLAPDADQIVSVEHVTATWPGGSLGITITIAEEVLSVEVDPSSVVVEVGGTVQFHSTVHYTCHDAVVGG